MANTPGRLGNGTEPEDLPWGRIQQSSRISQAHGARILLASRPSRFPSMPTGLGLGRGRIIQPNTQGGFTITTPSSLIAATPRPAVMEASSQVQRGDWNGEKQLPSRSIGRYVPARGDHPPSCTTNYWVQHRIMSPEHLDRLVSCKTLEELDQAAYDLAQLDVYRGPQRKGLSMTYHSLLFTYLPVKIFRMRHHSSKVATWPEIEH